MIVTASWDNTARLWDISKGEEVFVLSRHSDVVNKAFFSADGERIITASEDNTARIWDVATGKEIHVLKGHKAGLAGAAISPEGKWIVTASKDKTLRIWPGNSLEVLRLINEVRMRGKVRGLTEVEKREYNL